MSKKRKHKTVRDVWQMACPECGRDDHIDIEAKTWLRLFPSGTDILDEDIGFHEWTDCSFAECRACGFSAVVTVFVEERG